MALVLKSDKVATNPSIDWKYLSPFGPTHQEVASYLGAIMARGFVPPQAAFTGLDEFVTEMKDAGVWSKIPEVMPLYGGDYEGVRRKLKGGWGGMSMAAVNGDGIGNYEAVSGRYIGRGVIPWTSDNSPALDTGFLAGQLTTRFGFTAYLDSTTVSSHAALSRAVMGASLNAGSVRQTEARLTYTSGMATVSMQTGHTSNVGGHTGAASRVGVLRWAGSKVSTGVSSIATFDDGTLVQRGNNPNYDESVAQARAVWLFAKNPFNPDTTTWGYNGKVRFAAFDDGTMTDEQVAVYSAAVVDLMSAMGKGF